jgi:hypothetical protein
MANAIGSTHWSVTNVQRCEAAATVAAGRPARENNVTAAHMYRTYSTRPTVTSLIGAAAAAAAGALANVTCRPSSPAASAPAASASSRSLKRRKLPLPAPTLRYLVSSSAPSAGASCRCCWSVRRATGSTRSWGPSVDRGACSRTSAPGTQAAASQ